MEAYGTAPSERVGHGSGMSILSDYAQSLSNRWEQAFMVGNEKAWSLILGSRRYSSSAKGGGRIQDDFHRLYFV